MKNVSYLVIMNSLKYIGDRIYNTILCISHLYQFNIICYTAIGYNII